MAFDVEGAKKAGYSDAEIAAFLAQPGDSKGGAYGYAAAPPEKTKVEASPSAADYADVPGGGALPEVKPQAGSGGWGAWIDPSITPGPNVATLLPFSVDPATGHARVAVPNAVRAILTEGPRVEDGGIRTPAVINDPNTGAIGVTPEAQAGAGLISPGAMRFGAPRFVPPGTFDRPAELSPGFRANPMTPDLVAAGPRQGGPVTPTGVPSPAPPFEMHAVDRPAPVAQPSASTPASGVQPAMTQAEMEGVSKSYYSPADQQAAAGVTIHPDAAAAVRKPLIDAIPTDPEKAGYGGETSLTQLGKVAQANAGQPMSYDTAMFLDRQLTERKQAAYRSGDNTLAGQIGAAQDAVREKMQSLSESDTTGDPATLANLPRARQAYLQSIKQGQLEDIEYRAGLRPEDQRDAYRRAQIRSMLGSDSKMRNWSADERAPLEQALQSGNIGPVTNLGISLIKPFATAVGGTLGHAVGGVPGAIIGSHAASQFGETLQAKTRAALSRANLDSVSEALTRNMPVNPLTPSPGGASSWTPWAPRINPLGGGPVGPGSVDPAVMAGLKEQLAAAGSGGWRPVNPGEVFPPGQQFRMNQTTGVSEVRAPPSRANAAPPPSDAVPPGVDPAQWQSWGSVMRAAYLEGLRRGGGKPPSLP